MGADGRHQGLDGRQGFGKSLGPEDAPRQPGGADRIGIRRLMQHQGNHSAAVQRLQNPLPVMPADQFAAAPGIRLAAMVVEDAGPHPVADIDPELARRKRNRRAGAQTKETILEGDGPLGPAQVVHEVLCVGSIEIDRLQDSLDRLSAAGGSLQ